MVRHSLYIAPKSILSPSPPSLYASKFMKFYRGKVAFHGTYKYALRTQREHVKSCIDNRVHRK